MGWLVLVEFTMMMEMVMLVMMGRELHVLVSVGGQRWPVSMASRDSNHGIEGRLPFPRHGPHSQELCHPAQTHLPAEDGKDSQ